jgi:Fe-S-cluster-containing hydrogenase component 2
MVCLRECTSNAITGAKQAVHHINEELCSKCGVCKEVCKFDAVAVV